MINSGVKQVIFITIFVPVLLFMSVSSSFAFNGLVYGQAMKLGDGKIRAYMVINNAEKPVSFGVEISEAAFSNMPSEISDGRWNIHTVTGETVWYCCGHELSLDMPAGTELTPFRHLVVNWNPQGHIPAGIFDLAHFDFHFYTISEQTRTGITAPAAEDRCNVPGPAGSQLAPLNCDDFYTATKPLPAGLTPPRYISLGAVEPGMGNHLLDLSAPEFNGGVFTHTWIWGAWDADIAFFEPMITTEYLQSLKGANQICVEISMPQYMTAEGWYPTEYCMEYKGNISAYRVSLQSWMYFNSLASQ